MLAAALLGVALLLAQDPAPGISAQSPHLLVVRAADVPPFIVSASIHTEDGWQHCLALRFTNPLEDSLDGMDVSVIVQDAAGKRTAEIPVSYPLSELPMEKHGMGSLHVTLPSVGATDYVTVAVTFATAMGKTYRYPTFADDADRAFDVPRVSILNPPGAPLRIRDANVISEPQAALQTITYSVHNDGDAAITAWGVVVMVFSGTHHLRVKAFSKMLRALPPGARMTSAIDVKNAEMRPDWRMVIAPASATSAAGLWSNTGADDEARRLTLPAPRWPEAMRVDGVVR